MGIWSAVRVHLAARRTPGLLVSLALGLMVVAAGIHRQVLLPFSTGILIDLPNFTPVSYAFTAVLLASPRIHDLDVRGSRETRVRLLVVVGVAACVCLSSGIASGSDGLWMLTMRNALLFYGLGLLLCRLLEPALAAVAASMVVVVLAFLGSTPDGVARAWALPLREGASVPAAWLAVAVLTCGIAADVWLKPGTFLGHPEQQSVTGPTT